jgi:RHS repeat-associated protein
MGDAPPTTHLYTGHERDLGETSTELDYMHARYYSYNLGRFTSIDPSRGTVGSSQSWNRYSYVLNKPLNMVDPTGRAGKEVADQIDVAIEAAVDWYADNVDDDTFLGSLVNDTAVAVGTVASGFADMLRLGSDIGEVIGEGGDVMDIAYAGSTELGRASAIVLTVAAAAQAAGTPSTTVTRTTLYTEDGTVTVPRGYVRSSAANGKGVVYRPSGSGSNANSVRVMQPTARNPSGYVRVYNQGGQPINVATGKPGPPATTHPSLTRAATTKPIKVVPVPPPQGE